jgi:FixJ family two-component response regulator
LQPDPERPGSCASAAELAPPTISIVDDDLSMRRALRRLVQSAGYPVETFASAHEYLAATPRARGGCLVLDIHMEGMNGFELQERLASDRCSVPIIFITALTAREAEVFALVVTGLLNKQIGSELGITEKTVKVHRARVMEKMRASSLAQLVRLAGVGGVIATRA